MEREDLVKHLSSKTFCILPWIHMHVLPDGEITPCCLWPYDKSLENAKEKNIKEVWNSDKYKKLRLEMLEGNHLDGCRRCYEIEELGFKSMRQENNRVYAKYIDQILETNDDGSVNSIDIKYFDVRMSNLCNFKCRGCSPTLSSSWHDDHQALFKDAKIGPKLKSIPVDSPVFWREVKSLIPNADEIYFGGGEPLIIREYYEVLKNLDSLKKYDVKLSYNTNLSQLHWGNENLADIWSRFKFVKIGISLDDIGKRAEYSRHGTKWNILEKNMFDLKENYQTIYLYVNCTVSALNVLYLPDIFNYLINNEIIKPSAFNINLLLDPEEMTIQILPKELKDVVRKRLYLFQLDLLNESEKFQKIIYDINNIIRFMDKVDNSDRLPHFITRMDKLDELRGESFSVTYPELMSYFSF